MNEGTRGEKPPAGTVTDELLYAYVDGELDVEAAARVALAATTDPALALRIAQQRGLRKGRGPGGNGV